MALIFVTGLELATLIKNEELGKLMDKAKVVVVPWSWLNPFRSTMVIPRLFSSLKASISISPNSRRSKMQCTNRKCEAG